MAQKPIGNLIDKLHEIREKRQALAAEDKKLVEEFGVIEAEVEARLEAEGMDKAAGKKASISIGFEVVPTIKDWDELCKWVKKTGNFQIFQRRVSSPAFRELLELKKDVKGIEPFHKKKLSLTTRS